VPGDVSPPVGVTMPEVQHRAAHTADSGADISVDTRAPIREMLPVRAVFSKDSPDTARVPVSAKRMRHHMVSATRDTGVIETMFLQHLSPRRPRKPAVPVTREITLEQLIWMLLIDARKAPPAIARATEIRLAPGQPDDSVKELHHWIRIQHPRGLNSPFG